MNNLVLLTSHFPYEGGEQFLESEIKYWKNTGFDNVYIIPCQTKGSCRSYPKNIKVIKPVYRKHKANYLLLSLFSPIYYKELLFIKENSHLKQINTLLKLYFEKECFYIQLNNALNTFFCSSFIK